MNETLLRQLADLPAVRHVPCPSCDAPRVEVLGRRSPCLRCGPEQASRCPVVVAPEPEWSPYPEPRS